MGLAQGHKAVTGNVRTRNPIGFESSTLTLRCAQNISSEQNIQDPRNRAFYILQPASWHNTDKAVTACLYGRESRDTQGKNTTSC